MEFVSVFLKGGASWTHSKQKVFTYRNFLKAADDTPESKAYKIHDGTNVMYRRFFFAVTDC